MEAKLDIVEKCCGKEMQQLGGFSHDKTVIDEDAYICFGCGMMVSMKIEVLDEEVLESYKETYQEEFDEWSEEYKKECTNCSQENQETGFPESWDGVCPDCGRTIITKE